MKKIHLLIAMLVFTVTVNAQAPDITAFSPGSGSVGTTVTITGTNFNATPANNVVFFGATRANVTAASATSLSVSVPMGATHDFISVLNSDTDLMTYSATKYIPTYSPNTGTITAEDFESAISFPAVGAYSRVAIADLDGDSKPDFAMPGNEGIISILRNTSTPGTLSCAPSIDLPARSSYTSYDISIGDIDSDGKPDLVSTYTIYNGSNFFSFVSVYRNTSTPGSISFAERLDFGGNVDGAKYSRIADIDGDGKPDIIHTQPSTQKYVLRNTSTPGNISFDEPVYLNGPNVGAEDLQVGDLDGDGKPDLAFTSFLYGYVSVLRNTSEVGNISFATYVNFPVATNFSEDLSIGDIDGDGMLDITVVSWQFFISLFRNISTPGTLAFEPSIDIDTGVNSRSIPLGDIDGDGKLDMATQDFGYHNMFLYKNQSSAGNISFADKVVIPGDMEGLQIADVDGDGIPELVGVRPGTLFIFKNSPAGLSVSEVEDVSGFSVYPNPVKDVLNISSQKAVEKVEIYSPAGQLVLMETHKNQINMDALPAGIYMVKVISAKKTETFKVIKK